MAILMSSDKKQVLIPELEVAVRIWSRTKGLLGTRELPSDRALWIHRCNSIHTFFMKYSIDCVFLDKDLKIKALVENVNPSRMVMPIWGASSVIEMAAGKIQQLGLRLGDNLYVGD